MTNFNSNAGILLQNISFLRTQNNDFQLLQYQLTSQKKYQDLKQYSVDAYRIISFNQDLATRENYVANIGRAQSLASTYTTSLDNLTGIADNVIKATTNSIGNNTGLPDGLNTDLANNFLRDIEATLNISFGGRYIYGGSTYDKAPVKDLTTLPTLDTSVLKAENQKVAFWDGVNSIKQNTVDVNNNPIVKELGYVLPYFRNKIVDAQVTLTAANTTSYDFRADVFSYLNDFGADQPGSRQILRATDTSPTPVEGMNPADDVWLNHESTTSQQQTTQLNTSARLRVSNERLVDYGITATEPAFQKLIYAAINLKAAAQTGLSGDDARAFVDRARKYANEGLTALRELQIESAQITDRLNNYKELHVTFIQEVKTNLGQLQDVDASTVAVLISNLQTTLQASYTAIGKQQQLSLVNYLK